MEALATCGKDVVELTPIATQMAVTFLNGEPDKAFQMAPWGQALKAVADCKKVMEKNSPDLIIIQ